MRCRYTKDFVDYGSGEGLLARLQCDALGQCLCRVDACLRRRWRTAGSLTGVDLVALDRIGEVVWGEVVDQSTMTPRGRAVALRRR
jgi:hypothetical protein